MQILRRLAPRPHKGEEMKSVEITITLPAIIFEWLKHRANQENRSVSGMARHAITTYLGQKEGKNNLNMPPESVIDT